MEWQAAALDIWARKYCWRDPRGVLLEATPLESLLRVARALAAAEATPEARRFWAGRFEWAVAQGAIPAGRIIANAGKPGAGSLLSCAVSGPLGGTPAAVLDAVREAGATLLGGAGVGFDLSVVRPRALGGPGVLAILDLLEASASMLSATGSRRGAQIAVLDIAHPEVGIFVAAKTAPGAFPHFNFSLAVGERFMASLLADEPWPLVFPLAATDLPNAPPAGAWHWRPWPALPDALRSPTGLTACQVHGLVPARVLWREVMRHAWQYAEPGILFMERHQRENPTWFCETPWATNPCGEQGMPAHGTCVLGSLDLTRFVGFPFSADAFFDFTRLSAVTAVFTRMLDNAVTLARPSLAAQRTALEATRRHGMGVFGLGSALAMLGLDYAGEAAQRFAARVMQEMALAGWETALALGEEKGIAPALARDYVLGRDLLARQPILASDGFKEGDVLAGAVLHARYGAFFQRLAASAPELVSALARRGARFTQHLSIAPTGSISLAFGNNASSGIDPSFAHAYQRRFATANGWQEQTLCSLESLLQARMGHDGCPPPPPGKTLANVPPAALLAMQAAVQPWVDAAISRTVQVAATATLADVASVYLHAWQRGLKGCAVYRPNAAGPPPLLGPVSSTLNGA